MELATVEDDLRFATLPLETQRLALRVIATQFDTTYFMDTRRSFWDIVEDFEMSLPMQAPFEADAPNHQ